MSYALRNSLILGGLLILVLSLGGWIDVRQNTRIGSLQVRKTALEKDLRKVNAVVSLYESTRARLDSLETRWRHRQQIIPVDDTPARTLAYLNLLSQKNGGSVTFSFLFKGRQDRTTYSVNRYALEGEARFEDLYAFLWDLEHGRSFYTVDQLEVTYHERDVNTDGWDHINFKMIFRAYFDPKSQIQDRILASAIGQPESHLRNPFRPLITQTLPENEKGLLNVEDAQLKGLTQTLAYLEDKKGRMSLLHEGDRVYLGRLDKIDIRRNQVEFVLDKGGIWERLTLTPDLHTPQSQ